MTNSSNRVHWRARAKEANKWKRFVWSKCWHLAPKEPLKKAKVTLTRYSSKAPDFDGLVSSFKHCLDSLVESKILENDTFENIGQPTYNWFEARPCYGYIKIEVEEI